MSEPARAAAPPRRRIRAQASAGDPLVMGFVLDDPLPGGGTGRFDGPAEDVPLAQALFAIHGVTRVEAAGSAIWVRRDAAATWAVLKPVIAATIRDVLDTTGTPLGRAAGGVDPDADLLHAVQNLLERQVNPSIAAHGGHIAVTRVRDAAVHLRMSGGCQGCAASAATLRDGVERMLRAALPGIGEIVDVTDHEAGENPFYSESPGTSPAAAFNRMLPPGVVSLDQGQVIVDPDYLAARLGLDAQALRKGLQSGAVVSLSETGSGSESGRTRIVVRSPQRAWAAEILPDGRAREVPPPRAAAAAAKAGDALRNRVRAHLDGLPVEALPIGYGRLARALGMYMPGSVGKLTSALEATMREDAAAGRPFVAALAVSRGRPGLPGRGFFDRARALGRGPAEAEDEDEAAFHAREMAAALAARPPHPGRDPQTDAG